MSPLNPTQGAGFPAGGFRVGTVLSRAMNLYAGHFLPFTAVMAMVQLPLLGLTLLEWSLMPQLPKPGQPPAPPSLPPFLQGLTPGMIGTMAGAFVIVMLIWMLLLFVAQMTVLDAGLEAMRNRPIMLGRSFGHAVGRLLPALGMAICAAFFVFLCMLLLIVPGIMAMVALYVALPACLLERLGPIESLKRSAALTKGHRWKIFGIIILLALVGGIASALPTAYLLVPATRTGAAIIQWVVRAIVGAFTVIVVLVMYRELRTEKEGVDLDDFASAFD